MRWSAIIRCSTRSEDASRPPPRRHRFCQPHLRFVPASPPGGLRGRPPTQRFAVRTNGLEGFINDGMNCQAKSAAEQTLSIWRPGSGTTASMLASGSGSAARVSSPQLGGESCSPRALPLCCPSRPVSGRLKLRKGEDHYDGREYQPNGGPARLCWIHGGGVTNGVGAGRLPRRAER